MPWRIRSGALPQLDVRKQGDAASATGGAIAPYGPM
jgi:hypothetical protein